MTKRYKGEVSSGTDLQPKLEVESTLEGKIQADAEINIQIQSGSQGLSAYEIWLRAGNSGTEQDFVDSLKASEYSHPDTHSANMIVETEEKQFISTTDKLKLSGFIHDQIASSEEWAVEHTLEKFPSVSVVDSGGNLVIGDVEYISKSRLKILFNYEFSGKAYLN